MPPATQSTSRHNNTTGTGLVMTQSDMKGVTGDIQHSQLQDQNKVCIAIDDSSEEDDSQHEFKNILTQRTQEKVHSQPVAT